MNEKPRKDALPSADEIREAFDESSANDSGKKSRPAESDPPIRLERNTMALSLVLVLIGLFCLPNLQKGSDTWYVLMFVFLGNAVLLMWILARLILRRVRKKRADSEDDPK